MNRHMLLAGCLSMFQAWGQNAEVPSKAVATSIAPEPGPFGRKSQDESKVKKEVTAFLKQEEDIVKRVDFEASLARIDFPIFMLTDNAAGVPSGEGYTRGQYVEMMKPMWANMPKDLQTTHRYELTVLSDAMVGVVDSYSTKMGKEKLSAKNMSLLVKRDGAWKWKTMMEAGWGDTPAPSAAPASVAPTKK
jgi:hypothetical protein